MRRRRFGAALAELEPSKARTLFIALITSELPFDNRDVLAVGLRGLADAPGDSTYRRIVSAIGRGHQVGFAIFPSKVWVGDALILRDTERELENDPGVRQALEALDRPRRS